VERLLFCFVGTHLVKLGFNHLLIILSILFLLITSRVAIVGGVAEQPFSLLLMVDTRARHRTNSPSASWRWLPPSLVGKVGLAVALFLLVLLLSRGGGFASKYPSRVPEPHFPNERLNVHRSPQEVAPLLQDPPAMCAHRGKSDLDKDAPLPKTLVNLCIDHKICCCDYDVSLSSDGVPFIGHPSDALNLFQDKENRNEQQLNKTGSGPGRKLRTLISQYHSSELLALDPQHRTICPLVDIVSAVHTLRMRLIAKPGFKFRGKLLYTLEPKAPAEAQGPVIAAIQKQIVREAAAFAIILFVEQTYLPPALEDPKHGPRGNGARNVHRRSGERPRYPFAVKDEGFQFAISLKDRTLAALSSYSDKLTMCLQICLEGMFPWASYTMPSIKFTQQCAPLLNGSVAAANALFFKRRFDCLLRPTFVDHRQGGGADPRDQHVHRRQGVVGGQGTLQFPALMAWLVDSKADWEVEWAGTGFAADYIISNKPVEISRVLMLTDT
jgi:hypothetical protein